VMLAFAQPEISRWHQKQAAVDEIVRRG
jgi:hypothetical protein